MAYAAVASLLQTIDLILNYHQHSISPQFKHQIISLHKHIIFLQSFLEDVTERTNNWEETIREVADRAEDIIELLLSDLLLESSKCEFENVRDYEVLYGFDELERVTEEIEAIADRVKGKHTQAASGSDEDLLRIISRLREGSSAVEKIAVVGMGGIGKTTLARNAYNHPLILEHFDIRAWSTMSARHDWRQIALDLLQSMNKSNSESISNSNDVLLRSIYEILWDKRYLMVLDDVTLLKLFTSYPNNRNGSRIIFTTRSSNLSKFANHIHEMQLLDEDKTWNLLRQKIFEGDPCPFQLESIGKTIARSCGGHPLSIVVVSGILAYDRTEAVWKDVSENIKIDSEDGDKLREILYLSYIYLPHHLRACFLFLGIFPEKEEIHITALVKLWVAEGFLNHSEDKSFEETGEEYVEVLVSRGLVSVSKRKSNGRIKSITVHDLVRDWYLRRAQEDNFLLHFRRFVINDRETKAWELQRCRRVCNLAYGDNTLEKVYGSTIRTMLYGSAIPTMFYGQEQDLQLGIKCLVRNASLLRILDLSNAYYLNLPEEVFELFHLRYLVFDCWFSISEAISNLQNLQTLIFCSKENGRMFDKLPEGIWRLPQLRHLLMFRLELPGQKGATFVLENLQTLSSVKDLVCSKENLKMIPNLKKLNIFYTERLKDVVEDIELHNLIYLQKLEILKIEMESSFVERHKTSCAFPSTLKKLNLCGLQLPWEDMRVVASLPNLEVLKLRNRAFVGDTWETSEGGFSELTFLLIEDSDPEHWITETTHFPKLKSLVLHGCLYLLEVPNGIGEIPTLELIVLDKQNNQTLLSSAKRIQKDRRSVGDDHLQVHVV